MRGKPGNLPATPIVLMGWDAAMGGPRPYDRVPMSSTVPQQARD